MDRYNNLKQKIIDIAPKENVKLILMIGSFARKTDVADIYSDIDLIIVTDDVECWLYGDVPEQLGDIKISFVEPTLGGGKERRILLQNYLDVDMVMLTEAQFNAAVIDGVIFEVTNRGYQVLYDAKDYALLLTDHFCDKPKFSQMSEEEFINMVNDFYFHVVWATKKLHRGELWSAKMCIDGYLKRILLSMIELYSAQKNNCDVWHDGRFLDKWAEDDIRRELKNCFAHYDRDDMKNALMETKKLFDRLSSQTAKMLGYKYPIIADKSAEDFLINKLEL